LTAGFLAKFYVVSAGASNAAWLLIWVLVVTSVFGLFYYLRIIVALYSDDPEMERVHGKVPAVGAFALAALLVLLLWFGVYPGPLLNLIHSSIL
jgi:NADH-quinone oxidoreductase subunit N